MQYPYVDRYDFSLLSKAFLAGLGDSFSAGNIATVLIFVLFLSVIGLTGKRVFLLGLLFVGIVGGMQFSSVMGAWDHVITHLFFLNASRFIYLLLAIYFLYLGIVNIADWWKYKKSNDIQRFRLNLPVFLHCGDKPKVSIEGWLKKIFEAVRFILLTVFIAFVGALLALTFPQNEYIFIVHSFMMAGGDKIFVNLSFILYSLAVILPLIALWILIVWIFLKKRGDTKAILYYKLTGAALCLSAGIGIGCYFLI